MEEALKVQEQGEMEDLWNRYKADRSVELRNEIVLAYTWLVRKIVLRFKGSYSNFGQLDDMVNQGMIALIDSVERFEPDRGNKFESFASIKIKGSIIDFMGNRIGSRETKEIWQRSWRKSTDSCMQRQAGSPPGKSWPKRWRFLFCIWIRSCSRDTMPLFCLMRK